MTDAPPAPILDQVRAACREVAAHSAWVAIDHDRLPAYAASLRRDGLPEPAWDTATHFRGSPEATAAFVLTLDSVNFGSGWFPLLRKRPGMSGYYTVATALRDRFVAAGPIPAAELAAMTAADCAALFGQRGAPAPVRQLTARFAASLNDLGRLVEELHGGRFLGLVEAADGSAERLAGQLLALPSFRDVATHRGRPVPCLKRAQLTAADLALALDGAPPADFGDLGRLTIFADNLVPHVLRVDGVLRYHPELAARIDRGDLLRAGSAAEVEIRAGAVDACERLVALLRVEDPAITAQRLDFLLWHRGQDPTYKAFPRHRARSTFY